MILDKLYRRYVSDASIQFLRVVCISKSSPMVAVVEPFTYRSRKLHTHLNIC